MLAAAPNQTPLLAWLVGGGLLVALLLVVVARRRAAGHELRAVCAHCESPFQARATTTFLGFRELTCTVCGTTGTFPMPAGLVAVYGAMLLAVVVGAARHVLSSPEPQVPQIVVWAPLVAGALVRHWRLARGLRGLAARTGTTGALMRRVPPQEPRETLAADSSARPPVVSLRR